MKTLLLLLLPLFIFSQQKKDSVNFHLLSEFAVNKKQKAEFKDGKLHYGPIHEKGDTLSRYEITKIDSLGIFYIIEAKNSKFIYRILSEKNDEVKSRKKIEVGGIYQLDLRDIEYDCSRNHIAPNRIGFPTAMMGGGLGSNDDEIYDLDARYRLINGLYCKALNIRGLSLISYSERKLFKTIYLIKN